MNIVTTIVQDVVGATSEFLSGMGTTLVDFFDATVIKDGKLTTFAGWTLAFIGVGFGSRLISKLMHKVG